MSDNKSTTATGGLGFCGALTIAFIVLKLCHTIDWSWWYVLLPSLIPLGLALLLLLAIASFLLLAALFTPKRGNR